MLGKTPVVVSDTPGRESGPATGTATKITMKLTNIPVMTNAKRGSVAGPLSRPDVSLTTTRVFPSIVAQIYAPLTMNGIHTGAFPSSHVGMSIGLVLGLAPRRGWVRIALGGLVLGIAASTVYGQFHYAIDTVAGLGAGGLLYVGWARLYTVLESRPAPVTKAEANEPALMLPPSSSGGSGNRKDRQEQAPYPAGGLAE